MLLHQFHRLTENKQFHYLLLNGVCVADRTADSQDFLLFQLSNYYVEIIFEHNSSQIVGMNCFRDLEPLNPYLEEINIKAAFN